MNLLRISGTSMSPTLQAGDHVLVLRLTAREGDIVALLHPRLGRMVKRLGSNGSLHSDHASGTESERLGTLSDATYIGRVVLAVGPSGVRRLRVRRPYSPRA